MAVITPPAPQLEFGPVITAGNPIQRPRNSAQQCQDFRIMPGKWLRLRSGRKGRYNPAYPVIGLYPCHGAGYFGYDQQMTLLDQGGGGAHDFRWHWFLLSDYQIRAGLLSAGGTQIESIPGTETWLLSQPAPYVDMPDRIILYNGMGTRTAGGGGVSTPPFSYLTKLDPFPRYFGLDPYVPLGTAPNVVFAGGAGYNQVTTAIKIYVGLYNAESAHYSNGVYCGTIGPTGGLGAITIQNLQRMTHVQHDATVEQWNLNYCFYATLDNGQVPYLVTAASGGVIAVSITGTTATLSLANDPILAPNGFYLDLTKEMPTTNNPPPRMTTMCYVNGRLYGAAMPGSGVYYRSTREAAAVIWSAANGDASTTDFLGDPMQSWPAMNIAFTPSGERPLAVYPALDNRNIPRILVITSSATFLLEEAADGMHEFTTVSRVHGIANPATLQHTNYGTVWVTQRNQIVGLQPDATSLEILSVSYDSLMTAAPKCSDYVYDPPNLIDRYQAWLADGNSVCHDFGIGGGAYTATGWTPRCAMTVADASGRTHRIIADTAFYTHEGQPEDNSIPVADETFTGGTQSKTSAGFTGVYVRNWDDFNDADTRKELPMVDLIGDAGVLVDWWGDFEQFIDANAKPAVGAQITQSLTDMSKRYRLAQAARFWYKLRFKLASNPGGLTSYPAVASEGNNVSNFYGSILRALWRLGIGENRG